MNVGYSSVESLKPGQPFCFLKWITGIREHIRQVAALADVQRGFSILLATGDIQRFEGSVEHVSLKGPTPGRSDYSGRINLLVDYDEPTRRYYRCEAKIQTK